MIEDLKIAAIYSRKSKFTGKGESIENQVQICREHITSLGIKQYKVYEDEGFSGKNLERPNFKIMLQEARTKKFDILICYRLDRISRNIGDFSNLISELQTLNIGFISVKEQFDTTTPMGRAMMYIASVFAQLERETIAERVKDNMLELAKSGRWLGGQQPFGYTSEEICYFDSEMKERKMFCLSPLEKELKIVSLIYNLYAKKKSISQVYKFLCINNFKTKMGGGWSKSKVQLILRNPLYVKADVFVMKYLENLGMNVAGIPDGNHGILIYNKSKGIKTKRDISEWIAAVSKHEGVIHASEWLAIQNILQRNRRKIPRLGTSSKAVLTGLLKCKNCKNVLLVKYGHTSKVLNRKLQYYVCSTKEMSTSLVCKNLNIRTEEMEKKLFNKLKELPLNKKRILSLIKEFMKKYHSVDYDLELKKTIYENIEEKESKIQNLIEKLSFYPNLTPRILKQIEILEEELSELKHQFTTLSMENNNEGIDFCAIQDFFVYSLQDIETFLNALSIEEKKTFLKELIKELYWDGLSKTVEVYL